MSTTHFIKSANVNGEKISPTDRWILACLVKGLQKDSDISKISLDTIAKYCQYVDKNGKEYTFGVKAVQSAINRLANANKIDIIPPDKKGKCTKYKIHEIKHFEKLNEAFFTYNLPPMVKGYILCGLEANLNRNDNYEPNSNWTKTTYNIIQLSKEYNMPISSIYKAEKILKDTGILSITPNPEHKRDSDTGLIIQDRSIDLDKIGLSEFVILKLKEHEEKLNNTYTKEESDAQMKKFFEEELKKLHLNSAKEVEYYPED